MLNSAVVIKSCSRFFVSSLLPAAVFFILFPAAAMSAVSDTVSPPSFTYELTIGDMPAVLFQSVYCIGSEHAVIEHSHVNQQGAMNIQKIPGQLFRHNIVLQRGISGSLEMWKWRRQIVDGRVDDARTNCSISAFNVDGNEVARWIIINAWPSAIDAPLSESQNHMVEEITLVHEGAYRTITSQNGCEPYGDSDGDGICDNIDPCPLDPDNDKDQDGLCSNLDNCPDTPNPDQADSDGDGIGDACDNCTDRDADGICDNSDPCPLDPDNDKDQDGLCANLDNCPDTPNPDQADSDGDGIGDACDNDTSVPVIHGPPSGGGGSSSNSLPHIDTLSAVPEKGSAPLQVILSASAHDPDGSVTYYIWHFSDGITVKSPSGPVTHTFTAPGTYAVSLTVVDNDGGRDSQDITVMVTKPAPGGPEPPPAPITPECSADADCDDGLFCNGREQCRDGACLNGESPCGAQQVCSEDLNECLEVIEIGADVGIMQKTIKRPAVRDNRCLWLRIHCNDVSTYDPKESSIVFSGPDGESSGVTSDSARQPVALFNYLLLPVCIKKDAACGMWTIRITTIRTGNLNTEPVQTAIESRFTIR